MVSDRQVELGHCFTCEICSRLKSQTNWSVGEANIYHYLRPQLATHFGRIQYPALLTMNFVVADRSLTCWDLWSPSDWRQTAIRSTSLLKVWSTNLVLGQSVETFIPCYILRPKGGALSLMTTLLTDKLLRIRAWLSFWLTLRWWM